MPTLNRRRFLQVASAAGLAPALPALPARAAATTARGATSAQMLWASLQTRAGSQAAFQSVAQSMGISGTAAHGIYAKALQTQAISAHGTAMARRIARPSAPPLTKPAAPKRITFDLEQVLQDAPEPRVDALEIAPALDTEDAGTGTIED